MREILGVDFHDTFNTHRELWDKADLIITGTPWNDAEDILEFLDEHDIVLPVFFSTKRHEYGDTVSNATHKAKVINDVGVTAYYENDEAQITLLKTLCPKCDIRNVKTLVASAPEVEDDGEDE